MKLKLLALALLVACVVVPAAGAKGKPPKHSGGPPAHASSGGPPAHSNAGGGSSSHSHAVSASSQGSSHGSKPDKGDRGGKPDKHSDGDETATSDESSAEDGLNPAKTCKQRRAELGAEAFALEYGTNANLANAFGKCVSFVARGEESESDETEQEDEGADTAEPGDDGEPGDEAEPGDGEHGDEDDADSDTTDPDTQDVDQVDDGEDGFVEQILEALMRLFGR